MIAARDVIDLLLHPLDREVVDLRVPARALRAERAAERAPAVGLDHRRQLSVKELVLDPGEPRRGNFVHRLVPFPRLVANRHAVGIAIERGRDRQRTQRTLRPSCFHEEPDDFSGEEIRFAQDVQVDLGVPVEVVDLPFRFERDVRAAYDNQSFRPDLLGDLAEVQAERLVPDVVAQHQHVRRVVRDRIEQPIGVDEEARLDIARGQVAVHDRLHVGHTKRHTVVGENAREVVAQIRKIDLRWHS